MIIESQNINFKSRNVAVRNAYSMCQKVRGTYPCISPTKLIYNGRAKKDLAALNLGLRLQAVLQNKIRNVLNNVNAGQTSKEFFKTLSELIKSNRLANCGELVRLAGLTCAVNGIQAIPILPIAFDKNERYRGEVDHVVLAIPPKGKELTFDRFSKCKDVVIIDPWLEIVDYAPNVEQKYKHENNLFNIKSDENLYIDPFQNQGGIIPEGKFAELRSAFPELVLNKNK